MYLYIFFLSDTGMHIHIVSLPFSLFYELVEHKRINIICIVAIYPL